MKMTDSQYILRLIQNDQGIPEIVAHNDRLRRIAKKLECSDKTMSLAEALEKIGHKRLVAPDMVIDLSERLEQAGQLGLPDFNSKSSIRDQAIFNMGLDAAVEALAPIP